MLLGVATPSQLIQDKNRTPFNVGQGIQLSGFRIHEAQPLLRGLVDRLNSPQVVLNEVLAWTGGQPFLTQKICKLICDATEPIPTNDELKWVQNLVKNQIIDNWEAQDEPEHLKTIRDRLLSQPDKIIPVLQQYQQILQQREVLDNNRPEHTELLLSGLVVKREGRLTVANYIYATIFNQDWITKVLKAHNS